MADIYSRSLVDFPERPAFSLINKEQLTYREFGDSVERLTEIFNKHGIKKGEKIAILGNNMPNWAVSYFAVTTSSRVVVPILPDFTAFEIVNVIEHSDSDVIVVSEKLQYKLSASVMESFRLVISMDTLEVIKSAGEQDYTLNELPVAENLASIIYTSGTSGASKGVMLTHRNLVSQNYMANKLMPIFREDVFLSILPLSHAYECSLGLILPFSRGAHVVYLDGAPTPSMLLPALSTVRPTIMLSVPLIVEKIYKNKIRPMFTKTWVTQFLYSISFIRRALHKVAGKKLCQTFGGRLRFFGIGGSKLDGVVERFLADAGFPYGIGYGLTETSPVIAVNHGAEPGNIRIGSVGPVISNVEVKIAEDGEILVRGELVMQGYWNNDAQTECALPTSGPNAGWLHTGDIGHLDEKGRIVITDRKKDMIVNDKGDNVAPQKIEGMLTLQPEIAQAMVSGDKRPYVVGLIVPDAEWALEWARANDEKFDFHQLQDLPAFRNAIRAAVDRVNADLSVIEKVRQFTFAEEAFSIENGEMTPSLKIRRHKIRERYASRIDGLYKT